jgi:glycosyltransferase involved in cell wall biosynthesis
MNVLLSILVASIPSRATKRSKLVRGLDMLVGNDERVEILVFEDNKRRSIGKKRNDLIHLAQGRYLTFVDDDDGVDDGYVKSLIRAIVANPDVDVFAINQRCWWNGSGPFTVEFGIENDNEPMRKDDAGRWVDLKRPLSHVCVWRSEIAKMVSVPDKGYYEDTEWSEEASRYVRKQVRVPGAVHVYVYDDLVTEGHDWDG